MISIVGFMPCAKHMYNHKQSIDLIGIVEQQMVIIQHQQLLFRVLQQNMGLSDIVILNRTLYWNYVFVIDWHR